MADYNWKGMNRRDFIKLGAAAGEIGRAHV